LTEISALVPQLNLQGFALIFGAFLPEFIYTRKGIVEDLRGIEFLIDHREFEALKKESGGTYLVYLYPQGALNMQIIQYLSYLCP
jgi:hypothetical protein